MSHSPVDRVAGCLKGVAVGDAIGKQSETLAHEAVRRHYSYGIRGFEGPPGSIIPRYAGSAKYEWRIGETTDDTERTLAVAQAILTTGVVSHESIGREMLLCKKSVHPGVKSLWEFHQAADPKRTTTEHDGCGAAIRVAPVGLFYRADRFDELVTGAREASISTHGGSLAIAAAASTAAAVSAAIEGASSADVFKFAERAALEAERRWPGREALMFAHAMRGVSDALGQEETLRPFEVAARWFPDRPLTIVPLAVALATRMSSAEEAILLAANIGGDSDSVASIAGAILGAIYPNTVNQQWCDIVERINHHNLVGVANELAVLRH
jgi:ADP-ribosylglycohydrolase